MTPPPDPSHDPFATEHRPAGLDAVMAELANGWADGENPRVEGFASRLAAEGPDALVELAYLEFCLAESAGLAPEADAYLARFPQVAPALTRLFRLHGVLGDSVLRSWSEAGSAALPEAGDEIGPYRLLRELGRGGLARVFLAEQSDLDDRLVVLKVAARPSPEAVLQARARHPHIVEILRQAQTGDGGLHLIAMPFLGGATLAAVLAREAAGSRGLPEALDEVAAPEFLAAETGRSASRDLLARSSRPESAAWIVARLAEALDHAARLGVTHGDLKPANILIAADGRPMLFDFNLAASWTSDAKGPAAPTGGTLAYMAPERLLAMADAKAAASPRAADRHKADLYALGLVLREILTGRPPEVPGGAASSPREAAALMAEVRGRAEASLWSMNRRIPNGLQPILSRCLAADPAARYGKMSDLAEDLDAWRERRPLLHASGPRGIAYRAARLIGRHRAGVAIAAAIVLIAALVAYGSWSVMSTRMRHQAEAKLAALWDSSDRSAFRGRRFGAWRLDDAATAEVSRRNLDRYGVFDRDDWRLRDDVRALGDADRIDLEMWLVEQAWRLASAWSRRPDSPDDWNRALALLDRSPDWAAIAAFAELRRSLRERLSIPAPAPTQARPPAWLEMYASGLAAEATDPKSASAAYDSLLAARPEALWARYRAAAVASRLGKHAIAAQHLARCLERRPNNLALLTQSGGCLLGAGSVDDALVMCDRALTLDPDYPDAYLIRALVRIRLEQLTTAQADVDRFATLSRARPSEVVGGRSSFDEQAVHARGSAPGTGQLGDAADAQAFIAAALDRQGRVDEALAAYDKAFRFDPEDLRVRAGRASLLRQRGYNEGINEMAVIIAHPRFEELVRLSEEQLRMSHFVAVHRLRNGATAEARAMTEQALALALTLRPEGTPESPLVAESRYALARVLSHDAVCDPMIARRTAELLIAAGRSDRRFLDDLFRRDPFFNVARKAIAVWLP